MIVIWQRYMALLQKRLNEAVKRNIARFPEDFMFRLDRVEIDVFLRSQFATLGNNIQIIRIFTRIRVMVDSYRELREKVEEMEKNNETNFIEIFRVLRMLVTEESKEGGKIGFNVRKLR